MNIQSNLRILKDEKKPESSHRISLVSKKQNNSSQKLNKGNTSQNILNNSINVEPPKRQYNQNNTPYFNRNIQPIQLYELIPKSSQLQSDRTFRSQMTHGNQNQSFSYKKERMLNHTKDSIQKHQNKKYESEVEKLTKICEQFFRQNQKLKEQAEVKEQYWRNKLIQLEKEVKIARSVADEKQVQIYEKMNHRTDPYDKSVCQQEHYAHKLLITQSNHNRSFSGHTQHRIQKLMNEVKQKQNQILKYMRKQSQYIQIYVQKEQLQHKLRSLQTIIENQNKKLEQYQREHFSSQSKLRNGMTSSKILTKPEENNKPSQYNSKLVEMLQLSSKQIERLNQILRLKIEQLQANKITITALQLELTKYKQNQYTTRKKQEMKSSKYIEESIQHQSNKSSTLQNNTNQKQLQKLRNELQNYRHQSQQLRYHLLNEQDLSTKLKMQIESLEKQLRMIKNEAEGNKNKRNNRNFLMQKQYDQGYAPNKNNLLIQNANDQIQAYEERIKSLKQENQELSQFIMQQNTQIVKLKDHIRDLTNKQLQMQHSLDKLASHEQMIPQLITRVNDAELKLLSVTQQYQKLLTQVENSCVQTESVHKQIEEALEKKSLQYGIKDFMMRPISARSQTGPNIYKTMNRNSQNSVANLADLSNSNHQKKVSNRNLEEQLLQSASQNL